MATATGIQGWWVFCWGKLPGPVLASTKPNYCPCMRTQTRGSAKGQVTHLESEAPAVLSCAASLSQLLLPAALLSAQPLAQCGHKTLILSQAPFAPGFSGTNDCVHSVQSPVHLIWSPLTTGIPKQTQSSLSVCENPWYDHPACLLHVPASIHMAPHTYRLHIHSAERGTCSIFTREDF